jgi:RHS repeat-associated protein
VRQTLDDAGAVLGSVQYDPWGVPTAGTPQPFGFTGELHRAGQVYLRARWYAPGQGRFVSEDPFAGFADLPYSLHAYQYAYSNPVVFTDPTGYFGHCALSLTAGPAAPAVGGLCVVATYAVAAAAGVSLGAVIACTGGIVCTSTSAPFPGPPVVPGPGPLPPDAQPRVLPDGPQLSPTWMPPEPGPGPAPQPEQPPARGGRPAPAPIPFDVCRKPTETARPGQDIVVELGYGSRLDNLMALADYYPNAKIYGGR